jgi:hypothetical protein
MTPRIPSVGDIERDYTKNASLGMEGRFAVLRSAQLIFELLDALSLGLFLRFLSLWHHLLCGLFDRGLGRLDHDFFFDFLAMVFPFDFFICSIAALRFEGSSRSLQIHSSKYSGSSSNLAFSLQQ